MVAGIYPSGLYQSAENLPQFQIAQPTHDLAAPEQVATIGNRRYILIVFICDSYLRRNVLMLWDYNIKTNGNEASESSRETHGVHQPIQYVADQSTKLLVSIISSSI